MLERTLKRFYFFQSQYLLLFVVTECNNALGANTSPFIATETLLMMQNFALLSKKMFLNKVKNILLHRCKFCSMKRFSTSFPIVYFKQTPLYINTNFVLTWSYFLKPGYSSRIFFTAPFPVMFSINFLLWARDGVRRAFIFFMFGFLALISILSCVSCPSAVELVSCVDPSLVFLGFVTGFLL